MEDFYLICEEHSKTALRIGESHHNDTEVTVGDPSFERLQGKP